MTDIKDRLKSIEEKMEALLDVIEKAAVLTTKKRNKLQDTTFAFPRLRKLPIGDAAHCRAAMSRFSSTKGMTPAERKTAYNKIISAAKKFGIDTTGFKAKYGGK